MSTPDDVRRLAPLALSGAAELLGTVVEKLPAGFQGLLENYGTACFECGERKAHNAKTIPYPDEETIDTDPPPGSKVPSFLPAAEALVIPATPSTSTRPTIQPPKGKRSKKLPPPPPLPKLPKGLKDGEK